MPKNIKTAFRVYNSGSEEFELGYKDPPVNTSHPEVDNIRLLGSMDSLFCQAEEFCPTTNIHYSNGQLLSTGFVNWDYAFYFSHNNLGLFLESLLSNQNQLIHSVIKDCESSLNKLRTSLSENEVGDFYKCIKDHWRPAVEHKNSMYNCIGFAFGIKEFISSKVYFYNKSLAPEKNVNKFIHVLNLKYGNKQSNIMDLVQRLDSENNSIKCYSSFEEFYNTNTTYKNNDIVLYFKNNFSVLLHGARFVSDLTEGLSINSFVSKLGHSYLVSHTAIDAFDRSSSGYGDELCYISGSASETTVYDEL